LYLNDEEITPEEAAMMERKICELSVSFAVGMNPDGKLATFCWKIVEYMYLKTGMMLSSVLGTLKIIEKRRQSDDRGGMGYEWVTGK